MLVLLGAAVLIVTIWSLTREKKAVKIQDDPAIEVRKAPKRYNHDLIETRFGRIETRLDGHDTELDSAWEEMKAIREVNAQRYAEIAKSLGRIEGRLNIPKDNSP